jgi:hypothetical protein
MKRKIVLCVSFAFCLTGCDELIQKTKQQPSPEPASSVPKQESPSPPEEKRFVFPMKSSPFPEASVALDSISGKLCKTYPWADSSQFPKGLPLCSELSATSEASCTGSAKSYRGFTYSFNGTKWLKGSEAWKYNEKSKGMDPLSEDQYDPLNLFTKAEKAKMALKEEQIRVIAKQFGVTYAEAWEDAKAQGYIVPPQH